MLEWSVASALWFPSMSEGLVILSVPHFQEKAIVRPFPDHLLPVIFFKGQE